jgi:hypothetical protein
MSLYRHAIRALTRRISEHLQTGFPATLIRNLCIGVPE